MHETGITKSLVHEVERLARRYGSPKIVALNIHVGALCPFSEDHVREHFNQEAQGTVAEHARLNIERGIDPTEPLAQDVALVSIEIEDIVPMVVRSRSVSAK